jgi:hypothetical protein
MESSKDDGERDFIFVHEHATDSLEVNNALNVLKELEHQIAPDDSIAPNDAPSYPSDSPPAPWSSIDNDN